MHSSCCRPYQQAASNQAIKKSSNQPTITSSHEQQLQSKKKLVGKNHKINLAMKNKKFQIQEEEEEEEESPKGKKNSRVKEEEERLHLQHHLSAMNRSCQGGRHWKKRTRLPREVGR